MKRSTLKITALIFALISPASLVATENESIATKEVVEPEIDEFDRDHWSFQPLKPVKLPTVQASEWVENPIDLFILRQLEENDLVPTPRASRTVLLRRLKYDLLGLPPTPDELAAFEADQKPGAYHRLVERFLSSPAYGERWAQHWLDLARFAETDGFEHDKVRTGAWKYRQWVINALNDDLSYDRFVELQLVGDQTGNKDDAIATMFCLAGPDMPDINEQDLRRHDKLNEIASTIGATLLGLQMHCAQCHDHKYDPISQADFYRLRGIFESAVPVMKRDRPVLQLTKQKQSVSPYLYRRGELSNQGPQVEPKPPRIACLGRVHETFDTDHPRKAFARWLFHEDNPLTARVMVNRVWQYHFGKSLCENPSDFGVVAVGPSHPQLLDWLALEFRESGWSLKHLHRLILTSAIYQQASYLGSDRLADRPAYESALSVDPSNNLYSRFPRKRLEGEVIRDALLAVSGQLNLEFGGPSVMPPLPPELLKTLLKGQWKTDSDSRSHHRRSIYVFARRNLRYPIFDVFDRPDAGASCARRNQSTTAIQSLQMLNSELTLQAAAGLCDRLLAVEFDRSLTGYQMLVDRLFLITLSRHPSPQERDRFCNVLSQDELQLRDSLLTACMAVLNSNEFVYID
ncbi:DUF1549 and DUF1553 domain-containing protein [Thalassoroseus pseudoceratinae]|uniref:DUF1549 and DUF1553 domain-containing protein n=1 Tax=Thalassoroseus pseudoceratinae TaxID=2713176 RepID=UPI0014210E5F|nr:DUF1549 and DUF1553 domain-containing protein [Thalassoroseus pseudoceratinae]